MTNFIYYINFLGILALKIILVIMTIQNVMQSLLAKNLVILVIVLYIYMKKRLGMINWNFNLSPLENEVNINFFNHRDFF